MRGAWRAAILPPALATLVFAASLPRASESIDFGFYPEDAQDCLYKAADSSNCDSGSVDTTNVCLCSNGGNFVTNTAKCLGEKDKKDLSQVYQTMAEACSNSKTPLTVSEEQYLANADVSDKTLTSVQPTSTKPPSLTKTSATNPSATSTKDPGGNKGSDNKDSVDDGDNNGEAEGNESKSGLSTGAKAGIIGGAVGVGVSVLGAIGFLIWRRKKKRDNEESHPMLAPDNGHMSLVPTVAETSALMAIDTPRGDWPNDAKWRPTTTTTDPDQRRESTFNWESPYDLAYPGGLLKPGKTPSPPGSPPLTSHSSVSRLSAAPSGVFELPGSERQPAEVPAGTMGPGGGSGGPPLSIPLPQSSEASSRYSGNEWVEINPEPETAAQSRPGSSR